MQITDLYQTKITCSTYNANIDSTDTVITVKLVDFNGNAVTNKSVTLTCDKGYFNKKNSTSISGTTTKSITLTTNSSGEITGTWTASEWGLCTFSANNDCNQVHVKEWKLISVTKGTLTVNDELKLASFTYEGSHAVNSNSIVIQSSNIPSAYCPNEPVRMIANADIATVLVVNTDGTLLAQTSKTSSTAKELKSKFIWKF